MLRIWNLALNITRLFMEKLPYKVKGLWTSHFKIIVSLGGAIDKVAHLLEVQFHIRVRVYDIFFTHFFCHRKHFLRATKSWRPNTFFISLPIKHERNIPIEVFVAISKHSVRNGSKWAAICRMLTRTSPSQIVKSDMSVVYFDGRVKSY